MSQHRTLGGPPNRRRPSRASAGWAPLAVRAAALAAAFAVPTASAHAAAWLEPVALIDQPASQPAVATGAAGDAVAVWERGGAIEARVRAPGGAFAATQLLVGSGGSAPDVAMADDGTAIAAWLDGAKVLYSLRPPGGTFGTPAVLSADGAAPSALQIVMNGAGDALVAYARDVAFAAIRPAGGGFETPKAVSTAAPCDLRAALGSAGYAALAWHEACGGSGKVLVARRAPGAAFGEAGQVAEIGNTPALAVGGDGTTYLAWERAGAIHAATAPAGGAFAGGNAISSGDDVSATPALAAGGGEAWAAWRASAAGVARIVAAHRAPGATGFGAAKTISPEGVAGTGPALQSSADGAVVAAWLRVVDEHTRLEGARRAAGAAAFDAAALVSAAGADTGPPDLTSDPEGNAIAGYQRGGLPVAHVLDGAGPRLLDIQMRATGFAKDPYPFSVSPADAWSAVASSAFDFGDGTSPPRPPAHHAFPEPAAVRTVTISATDSLGNVSRAQRPFDVQPALDRTPPVITDLRMDARRFRVSGKETAIAAAVRRGTRFRYTLSEPAQVVMYFERALGGRRSGRRCVRTRRGLRGRRCTLFEPAGLITRTHPLAGAVSVGFTGRMVARNGLLKVSDTRLKRGRYRATFVAADALRNVSAPVRLTFTVLG